ncbi:MAG: glycosyl hydrolase family 18 protein [Spirochaetes bacterium]|nr:glycosyl hydrolase family 18 protein [Spirochaetota bacterium]
MKGEEHFLTGSEPFTDICYFSATIDNHGNLRGDLTPPVLPINGEIPFRLHLVISELTNHSRTHYLLKSKSTARKNLIKNIVAISRLYDGIQIDFESVPREDGPAFQQFLRDLKKRLPKTVVSVALPPRRSEAHDAYNYAAISKIVDRVVIMAYDQHYRTSKPGPVASKSWSKEVAEFAIAKIPPRKLIMGLPLYGRAWQETRFDRALRYSHLENIISNYNITKTEDEEYGIRFEFEAPVRVIGYYESLSSIVAKLKLYASLGITSVSFWRIGQEDKRLWERIWVQ